MAFGAAAGRTILLFGAIVSVVFSVSPLLVALLLCALHHAFVFSPAPAKVAGVRNLTNPARSSLVLSTSLWSSPLMLLLTLSLFASFPRRWRVWRLPGPLWSCRSGRTLNSPSSNRTSLSFSFFLRLFSFFLGSLLYSLTRALCLSLLSLPFTPFLWVGLWPSTLRFLSSSASAPSLPCVLGFWRPLCVKGQVLHSFLTLSRTFFWFFLDRDARGFGFVRWRGLRWRSCCLAKELQIFRSFGLSWRLGGCFSLLVFSLLGVNNSRWRWRRRYWMSKWGPQEPGGSGSSHTRSNQNWRWSKRWRSGPGQLISQIGLKVSRPGHCEVKEPRDVATQVHELPAPG